MSGTQMISNPPHDQAICDEVRELLAGWALGAIDPDEWDFVERHIVACPPCNSDAERERQTATLLALTVPAAHPSLDVKASLFARIEQQHASPAQLSSPWAAFAQPLASTPTLPSSRQSFDKAETAEARTARAIQPRKWSAWVVPMATVPLVLALAIFGGWAFATNNRLQDRVNDLEVVGSTHPQQDAAAAAIGLMDGFVASSSARAYQLSSPSGSASVPGDGNAADMPTGKIIASPNSGSAIVLIWGLDPSEDPSGYKVMIEDGDGTLTECANLYHDPRGFSYAIVRVDAPMSTYRALHVIQKDKNGDKREVLRAELLPSSGQPVDAEMLSLER